MLFVSIPGYDNKSLMISMLSFSIAIINAFLFDIFSFLSNPNKLTSIFLCNNKSFIILSFSFSTAMCNGVF